MRSHIKTRYILGTTALLLAFISSVALSKERSNLQICLDIAGVTKKVVIARDNGVSSNDLLSSPEITKLSENGLKALNIAIAMAYSDSFIGVSPDKAYLGIHEFCLEEYGYKF